MTSFEKNSYPSHENTVRDALLSSDEELGITLRADVRRRTQELKIKMLNCVQPGATEPMQMAYKHIVARVGQEMAGDWSAAAGKTPEELMNRAIALSVQAESATTPVIEANVRMQSAKLRLLAGDNLDNELDWLRSIAATAHTGSAMSPLNFLPDATLVGIQKQIVEKTRLPSHERIAQALKTHRAHDVLRDWALVLPEKDRTQFLRTVAPEQEREVAIRLDEHASGVLHGARVESGTEDAQQRKAVRARVYNELRMAVEDSAPADARIVAALGRAMIHLGSDTKNLVLEILRDERDRQDDGRGNINRADYMPHVIGVLMKLINETDDFRANDIALQLVGDARTAPGVAASIFRKLVANKYLDPSLGVWWNEQRAAAQTKNPRADKARGADVDRGHRLEVLQALIGELGVVPSREVVEFLDDNKRWGSATLQERAAQIKASEQEFSLARSNRELVAMLQADETKAMTYYLLHAGEDRFNLINNYSFEKFKEMMKLISDLKEHRQPIEQFTRALAHGGVDREQSTQILERLRAGNFPGADATAAHQEVSFDVSENAAVKNANAEIGRVLGSAQLGSLLRAPLYREYIAGEIGEIAQGLQTQLAHAQTFEERNGALAAIEAAFPEWRDRVKKDLQENWQTLGEKMVLGITLDNVLDEPSISIRAEEIIPRLNSKRIDLKRMKKDLIVVLKSENQSIIGVRKELNEKRKAFGKLRIALEHQSDVGRRTDIQQKLTALDRQITVLEAKRLALGNVKVTERFAEMSKDDRDAQVEKLGKEIVALTEKSPSAIFTYLTMQAIGEDRLTEQDVVLIQEMESHLQGPFQTIVDAHNYQPKQQAHGVPARNRRIGLEWLDKRERLMSMVRFADSKICCFSSNNYEMKVQHDTPNKFWVASINADPMSFVIALEEPGSDGVEGKRRVHENEGFIFGSFAVDEHGDLGVMLNGIYYAPGVEDSKQVEAILAGVERMFAGLPVKTIAIATQYGGSVKMPAEYQQRSCSFTRLRALDAGDGSAETKVYDDLGTGSGMNSAQTYSALWVKQIKN